MRRITRSRGSVKIDTVPLPEKVARGKVLKSGKSYFLSTGGRRLQIPVGTFVSATDLRKMVGKDVAVAFSIRRKGEIVAIGTWPTPERPRLRCYWIVCYIPAPDMIRRIDVAMRLSLVRQMSAAKIISPRLAQEIRRGL